MNREALDEFFAKAEDVLTDWAPSDDAMVARVDDEGAELPVADSYYTQHEWPAFWNYLTIATSAEQPDPTCITLDVTFDMTAWQRAFDEMLTRAYREPLDHSETTQERALRLRRERNTGPSDRLGLDGHLRRRTTR